MNKIKCCPICGGEAIMTMHYFVNFTMYRIECKKKCVIQNRQYKTAQGARQAWNRRANEREVKENGN